MLIKIVNPIILFSQCQACFIQKISLEEKIEVLSYSILVGTFSYGAISQPRFTWIKADAKAIFYVSSILTCLFFSTIKGALNVYRNEYLTNALQAVENANSS